MNTGTSRKLRKNKALDVDHVLMDERSVQDLVNATLDYAKRVTYYNGANKPEGDWESFFMEDSIFVIAKIAAMEIDTVKRDNDSFREGIASNNMDAAQNYVDNFYLLPSLVHQWDELLRKSKYKGSLSEEIRDLQKSIDHALKPWLGREVSGDSQAPTASEKLLQLFIQRNRAYFEPKEKDVHAVEIEAVDAPEDLIDADLKLFETFDDIYGNMVFFKEQVSKKFNKEVEKSQGRLPHIGLLITFFKLFKLIQNDVNTLTKRHLDYYYDTLLRQRRLPKSRPHTAMVACALGEGANNNIIPKGAVFEFDMGEGGQIDFEAVAETTINRAVITDIKTIFKTEIEPFANKYGIDAFCYNMLYETDILKSVQERSDMSSYDIEDFSLIFGGEKQRLSDVGFMVSSPILILEKGQRTITLEFKLAHDLFNEAHPTPFDELLNAEFKKYLRDRDPSKSAGVDLNLERERIKEQRLFHFFNEAFDMYFTHEEGWGKIDFFNTTYEDRVVTITMPLAALDKDLVAFDAEIHGAAYDTDWPCIKVLLNNYATYHPYVFLKFWELEYIKMGAEVTEVSNLKLSNNNGNIDGSIPFEPFGSIPEIGSFLRIQNPAILQRNLASLALYVHWNGLPQLEGGFEKYYEAYDMGIKNESFKALITQSRNLNRNASAQKQSEFELFGTERNYLTNHLRVQVDLNNFDLRHKILQQEGKLVENEDSLYLILKSPEIGFGQSSFPEIYAKKAMRNGRFFKKQVPLPRQPHVPTIDELKIDYSNSAKENMLRKQDDESTDIKFFHLHPFGHVKIFPGSIKSPCYLLPQIDTRGNLLIGIQQVVPNEELSLGFELIADVHFHTVLGLPKVTWSYLNNNEWHDLSTHILDDSTRGLRKSGIVRIEVPSTLKMNHTRLPSDRFWLLAAYGKDHGGHVEDINSLVKHIFLNAVSLSSKAVLDPQVFTKNLTPKTMKISAKGHKAIEKITGPLELKLYGNQGDQSTYYCKVSELLRHKNRGITNWDIEHMLLEKFDEIEKVRVYGRNGYPHELAQGSNIQIVVIPKSEDVVETLFKPKKLDTNTLETIKRYAQRFMSPYAKVEVCNPVFEKLKVRCRVVFINAQKASLYKHMLNEELVHFLSPNSKVFDSEDLFEKSFTKTEILNFIEARPYIKNVVWFSVIQLVDVIGHHRIIDTEDGKDKSQEIEHNTRWQLRTISAYAILTSVGKHHIEVMSPGDDNEEIRGIGDAAIGSDFVVANSNGRYTEE